MATLTKEEFLKGYNSFPPNAWTKFAFRYFSKNTLKEDKWVSKTFQYTLIGLFLIGMIGTIFNAPNYVIAIPTLIFSILLFGIALLMSSAVIMNNFRIRKIRKFLKITNDEYARLSFMYLE